MNKPRYIVHYGPGGTFCNSLAEALQMVSDRRQEGGNATIYEPLAMSTAEQIKREEALAEACRRLLRAVDDYTARGYIAWGETVQAKNDCVAALAAHDAHVAEMEAAFPKDEPNENPSAS